VVRATKPDVQWLPARMLELFVRGLQISVRDILKARMSNDFRARKPQEVGHLRVYIGDQAVRINHPRLSPWSRPRGPPVVPISGKLWSCPVGWRGGLGCRVVAVRPRWPPLSEQEPGHVGPACKVSSPLCP